MVILLAVLVHPHMAGLLCCWSTILSEKKEGNDGLAETVPADNSSNNAMASGSRVMEALFEWTKSSARHSNNNNHGKLFLLYFANY